MINAQINDDKKADHDYKINLDIKNKYDGDKNADVCTDDHHPVQIEDNYC